MGLEVFDILCNAAFCVSDNNSIISKSGMREIRPVARELKLVLNFSNLFSLPFGVAYSSLSVSYTDTFNIVKYLQKVTPKFLVELEGIGA